MKAGKLVCGTDACIESIKKKKVTLLIVAEDASSNTKSKFNRIAEEYKVELMVLGEKENLSRSVGKVDKAVFAILDSGLSEKLKQIFMETKGAIK